MTEPSTHEPLRPERARAERYLKRRGTDAPVDSIRERLTAAFAQLSELFDSLSEEDATARPESGGWCVQEVADHLYESNDRALVELDVLLRGESPTDGPIPIALLSDAPMAEPWSTVRERLAELHRRIEQKAAEAHDGVPLSGRAPVAMILPADDGSGHIEWIQALDWKAYLMALRVHVLEHVAQVRRIVDAGSGRHT